MLVYSIIIALGCCCIRVDCSFGETITSYQVSLIDCLILEREIVHSIFFADTYIILPLCG